MDAEAVTLHLPFRVYDHFKQRAEARHRSLEAELLEVVATAVPKTEDLPADLEEAVAALRGLDDQALWCAARDRLPEDAAAQLEALNHKQQQREGLTPSEAETLAQLLRGYERVMLVRAEAAWLLHQRGHDVSSLVAAR